MDKDFNYLEQFVRRTPKFLRIAFDTNYKPEIGDWLVIPVPFEHFFIIGECVDKSSFLGNPTEGLLITALIFAPDKTDPAEIRPLWTLKN